MRTLVEYWKCEVPEQDLYVVEHEGLYFVPPQRNYLIVLGALCK